MTAFSITTTTTTILRLSGFCPGQPGWGGTRRNIQPLTPIVVIDHSLSASSIYYDPWHPSCFNLHAWQSFSTISVQVSLVCLLAWQPPLRTHNSVLWRCWLGGRKGIQPVKNWVVGCWHSCLSGVRCRFACGPAGATATHYLLLQQIQIGFTFLVLPFWYQLTRVIPDKV